MWQEVANESARYEIKRLLIQSLCEHISFPERVTLFPDADTLAKVYITTPGQSMYQHLHTFTQQVSATASYVLCFVLFFFIL